MDDTSKGSTGLDSEVQKKKELIKSLERKDNKFATSLRGSRKIPSLTILMLQSGALIEVGYIALV